MNDNLPELVPPRTYINNRMSERYDGAELRPIVGRPGATHALELPSRTGNELHYRCGRIETLLPACKPEEGF